MHSNSPDQGYIVKRASVRCLLSGLFSLVLLQPVTAAEPPVTAVQRAWLDAYRTEIARAILDETTDQLVSRYSGNVRLMPPYHGTVLGRDNARAYHAAFFERLEVRKYRREHVKTFDLGSRLIEVGRYAMSLTARGDTSHEISGGYMDIWAQAAGKPTSLITHVWNTDRYSDLANDLRFSNVAGIRAALEAHVPIKDSLSFELAALNKLHEVAITQHDHDVWAQFFADDAVLLANHDGIVQGRRAIDEYISRHARELPVFEKLDIRNDAIDAAGRFVIEYASHVANWRNGDSSGVNTGKNIRLWRREPDGSLKMICGIGTYD
jgi:ketosteroid isomerase-like protein